MLHFKVLKFKFHFQVIKYMTIFFQVYQVMSYFIYPLNHVININLIIYL